MSTSGGTKCSLCNDTLGEIYYKCEECKGGFQSCEDCFFASSEEAKPHAHALVRINSKSSASNAKLLFEHHIEVGDINGSVFLSNIAAALPSSEILSQKDIKAVFSILQPELLDASYGAMTSLFSPDNKEDEVIYRQGLDTIVRCKSNGVVYYNLNIADVTNPSILSRPKPPAPELTAYDVFSRAVAFIETWLPRGNLLVHCEQGRRRSPTAIVAFLVTQGMRTHRAIQHIGASYLGEQDWAEGYKKSREMWIANLSKFESEHIPTVAKFRLANPQMMKSMGGEKWTDEDERIRNIQIQAKAAMEAKRAEESKKRAAESPAQLKKAPPAKKYKLAGSSGMVPSQWANRKK